MIGPFNKCDQDIGSVSLNGPTLLISAANPGMVAARQRTGWTNGLVARQVFLRLQAIAGVLWSSTTRRYR